MTDAMQVDLSCEAGSNRFVLQFSQETAAEARARKARRRRELRQEVAAWRKVAHRIDADGLQQSGICFSIDDGPSDETYLTYSVMIGRIEPHVELSPDRWQTSQHCGAFAYRPGTEKEARVLACLFLALEAEDELNALTPVSRPSSLRRPRQQQRGR